MVLKKILPHLHPTDSLLWKVLKGTSKKTDYDWLYNETNVFLRRRNYKNGSISDYKFYFHTPFKIQTSYSIKSCHVLKW